MCTNGVWDILGPCRQRCHLVRILETAEIVKGHKEGKKLDKAVDSLCAWTIQIPHPIGAVVQESAVNMAGSDKVLEASAKCGETTKTDWRLHIRWVFTIVISSAIGMILWVYESKGTTRSSEKRVFNFLTQGGLLILFMNFPVRWPSNLCFPNPYLLFTSC